ncbi:hypothetical protein VTL71DRAFT_3805 [Oculimacula yallundae]|uniref:Uncharacterized protein n=1 Tax=Oculimacula yallundae TaxID=86028 RepID=A0ABR4C593_9HELO
MFEAPELWHTEQNGDRKVLTEMLQAVDNVINTYTGPNAFPMGQNVLALLPLRTSQRFVEMLDEHEPFAMAVLARIYALQHATERIWWMHGLEEMELPRGNVRGLYGLMPTEFTWMMEWPLDVAEGQICLASKVLGKGRVIPQSRAPANVTRSSEVGINQTNLHNYQVSTVAHVVCRWIGAVTTIMYCLLMVP